MPALTRRFTPRSARAEPLGEPAIHPYMSA
jgi:hypothetical protein